MANEEFPKPKFEILNPKSQTNPKHKKAISKQGAFGL
jgi:hypothetical protein